MHRAIKDNERQRRAEAVAIDNDLIGVTVANKPHELMREPVKAFLELWPDSVNEIAREIPIIQRVTDMDRTTEGPAQAGKDRQPQGRRQNHGGDRQKA